MKPKIANFNSLSALLDRLSIENVKLSHFEHVLDNDATPADERENAERRIEVLNQIIDVLKNEIAELMADSFSEGKYNYLSEQRTFK